MPKRSVSGRPFREDPNSYKRSGIPCGNPLRYKSSTVVRMVPDHGIKRQRLDLPAEDIETEAERQLKVLREKQTDKTLSLKGHEANYRTFTKSTILQPLTKDVSGEMSFCDYKDMAEYAKKTENLRQLGLSDDEIIYKLEHDATDAKSKFNTKRYGTDPTTVLERLHGIEDKIKSKLKELKKPDQFTGAKVLSRHEMDLERVLSHNKDSGKLLSCLVRPEAAVKRNNNMDIKSNLNVLLPNSDAPPEVHRHLISSPFLKHSRSDYHEVPKGKKKMDDFVPESDDQDSEDDNNTGIDFDSNRDPVVSEVVTGPQTRRDHEKECALAGCVESIPEEVIQRYKLNLTELKMIPRFKNYVPGTPNNTLFLKNLSPKITEVDLVSLFQRYENESDAKVSYNLLSGRMKGQAFVTFHTVEAATQALQLVNGYPLKGKPIVIVYGKKQS